MSWAFVADDCKKKCTVSVVLGLMDYVNRPVVFIHCPHSNPHPSQMGRVWVENNYSLKKWVGWVWVGYK
jgi:hypothetical protein